MLIRGWIEGEWKQSDNNRRARYYRLTQAGGKQLARQIGEYKLVCGAIAKVIEAI
jgi:DNA-binding PadR family transcriptional regulator